MSLAFSSEYASSRAPLLPADRLIALQGTALVLFPAWAGGGGFVWAPFVILAIVALGLPAIWLRWRDTGSIRLHSFIPAGFWLVLLMFALCNPSHAQGPAGGWLPRADWIPWLPTTVDRSATLSAEIPWLGALIEGGLIAAVRPHYRVIRFLWTIIAINGFALAAVGGAFHFGQAGEMLGFIETPEPSYFFATFFYKNHWAAYGALCAATGCALALRSWRGALAGDPPARGRVLLLGVTSLLTAITLPLPGSRTGAVLAGLLIVVFFGALLHGAVSERARHHGQGARFAIVLVVLGAAIVAYGTNGYWPRARSDLERTVRQFDGGQRGESVEMRLRLSSDTWQMAAARPWFGWGIGSFEIVFPRFQGAYLRDAEGRPNARVEFAHNDWLQMAAEAGIAGLTILLVPVMLTTRRGWRCGGIAGRWTLAGCGVMALIAFLDFPLNNPAVLMCWTILLVTSPLIEESRSPRSKRVEFPRPDAVY